MLSLTNLKWRSKEQIIASVAVYYVLILIFSRMMQGAHFLSDVTVGYAAIFVALFLDIFLLKE